MRPIAIGTILRKAISSAVTLSIKGRLQAFFSPDVGVPGGSENVIHGTRMLVNDNPHRVVVSLDLSNAFNTVSRQAFMDQVEHFFPDLAAWIWECYGQKQFLLVKGVEALLSATGVQQGDPLGPFLFCLALHPLLKNLAKRVTPLAYMDYDIYLISEEPENLSRAIQSLMHDLNSIGLKVNLSKCKSTAPIPGFEREIECDRDLHLLGAPPEP